MKSGQMQDKLASIRSQVPTKESKKPAVKYPSSADLWVKDGEDHINVGENAASPLGKMLSHRYNLPFNHSHFARFNSIEGFDIFIQSVEKDDRLRYLTGAPLRAVADQMTRKTVDNFRAILIDTYYQRIKQSKAITEAFIASTLPFDLYYVVKKSGLHVRPARTHWFTQGLEELRRAMQENREPNLSFLMHSNKKGIYEKYEKEIVQNVAPPKAAPGKQKAKKKPTVVVNEAVTELDPNQSEHCDDLAALAAKTKSDMAEHAVEGIMAGRSVGEQEGTAVEQE